MRPAKAQQFASEAELDGVIVGRLADVAGHAERLVRFTVDRGEWGKGVVGEKALKIRADVIGVLRGGLAAEIARDAARHGLSERPGVGVDALLRDGNESWDSAFKDDRIGAHACSVHARW